MEKKWWKILSRYDEWKKESELGGERVLSNMMIRKMLHLANASKNDVFYDLGCGLGQNLVVAVKEFRVKRAVGIDKDTHRAKKATEYLRDLNLAPDRAKIKCQDIYKTDLGEATIVYTGLEWRGVEEDMNIRRFYQRELQDGCKLVTLSMPLVGVIPDSLDFPFYLMTKRFNNFRKTSNSSEWISRVLSKRASREEFFAELEYDPDHDYDIEELEKVMRKRFSDM